jgi:EAL domain-containing protein (putative c-di-GMP-specific phosphodiesterase class I)
MPLLTQKKLADPKPSDSRAPQATRPGTPPARPLQPSRGELERALAGSEIVVFLQPQMELQSGRVVAVEALARWQHPERGLLAPSSFIERAEELGLAEQLTDVVLAQSLRCIEHLDEQGACCLNVAVNLSSSVLYDGGTLERVSCVLERSSVAPQRLTLEVTETALMGDPVAAEGLLGHLKSLGVRLSLDDFGTGYSSLARLQRLPLDEMKIDRSFLEQMRESGDTGVIAAIASLGRHLGLTVVAEGAEHEAELGLLAGLGCHLVQGYALCRPKPPAELYCWLKRQLADGYIRSELTRQRGEASSEPVADDQIGFRLHRVLDRELTNTGSLERARRTTLARLANELDADFAAWWQTDEDPERQQALHCLSLWAAPGLSAEQLEEMTLNISYAPGVGLPGRALLSVEPVWIGEIGAHETFPRASAALAAGLTHGLAIALRSGEETLGVVEFMGARMPAPDFERARALTSVGGRIGNFVTRRRALAAADLNAQMLADLVLAFRELAGASPERLGRCLCEQTALIAGADVVLLWGLADEPGTLEVKASTGWSGPPLRTDVLHERSAASSVISSRRALYVPNIANDLVTSDRLAASLGARAALFQPIPGPERATGVLCIAWKQPQAGLSGPTASAVELLADYAAHIRLGQRAA